MSTVTNDEVVGNDVEIQSSKDEFIHRGVIKKMVIENKITIKITFEWLAQNDGTSKKPADTWTKIRKDPYVENINKHAIFSVNGTTIMYAAGSEHLIIFYPKEDKLDPKKVKGLKL